MIRKTVYVVSAFIVILAALIFGLEIYFTSDRLKSMTEPAIEESLQRNVEIGEMSLEFIQTFPGAGVSMSNFMIPGPRQDTAASFKEVVVAVDLIPLLSRQINISDLMIDNPVINYRVYEDGSSNFDFEPKEESKGVDTTATTLKVNVPTVTINTARVTYSDEISDTYVSLNGLNGTVGLNYADQITTELALDISEMRAVVDTVTYVDGLSFSIKETSILDLKNEIITFKSGGIAFKGFQLDLKGDIKNWSAESPTLDLSFKSSTNQFGELLQLIPETYQQQIGSYDAKGSLDLSGTLMGTFDDRTLPALNATLEIKNGSLFNPKMEQSIEQISILAAITNKKIEVAKLNIAAGSNNIQANGIFTDWMGEAPSANLQSSLNIDLASISDFYPIDTDSLSMKGLLKADLQVNGPLDTQLGAIQKANFSLTGGYLDYHKYNNRLQNVEITGSVEGKQLRLKQSQFETDSSSVAISGTIDGYASKNPVANLNGKAGLKLAEIDDFYPVKPYLSKLSGLLEAEFTARGPVYDLTKLDLSGSMKLNSVRIAGDSLPTAEVSRLNAQVSLNPSTISFKTISTQIGKADLNFEGSVSNYRQLFAETIEQPVAVEGVLSSTLLHYDSMFPIEADTAAGEPVPMEIPNMTADIDIEADSIVYMGIGFYDASAYLHLTPEEITISKISTGLMEGLASGTLNWKIPEPLATNISFDGKVDSIASARFFREFQVLGEENSIYDNLSGAMNATISYQSDLNAYLEPELETSVANGTFGMSNSVLENHTAQLALARFLNQDELKRLEIDDWQAA